MNKLIGKFPEYFRLLSFITSFVMLSFINLKAQNVDSIAGTWKGTSICQIKNSPCHDEVIVYHVSQTGTINQVKIIMNKIVNDKEEDMGTLIFSYNNSDDTLISVNTQNNSKWVFHVSGNSMTGTLTYKNSLYRIIKAQKIN